MYILTVNSQNTLPDVFKQYETLAELMQGVKDTIKEYTNQPENEALYVYNKWENTTGITKKLIESSKGYGITMGVFTRPDSANDLGQALTINFDSTLTEYIEE